ncbi:helix-turn-helix domain-containing protein [Cohnella rhizosphaerae]|uniref:DUF559 domain-containing protein n=1 Tax=Cohnella rhizosphaerae TaxID=1457232 RepID=A0A9X4KU10_9BACL|nr:helix-turn-helix domain-containing protein [Cohnella rhizosphaerae]MDG0808794.1 hypothetical protein [Cohnella rhizosphaerae]
MQSIVKSRRSAVQLMLDQLRSRELRLDQSDEHNQIAFEAAFAVWWKSVLRQAPPRVKARLASGLTHASLFFLRYVWWPAFRSFKGLIPEYEIVDYKDGYRYIDFVYFTNGLRIAFELDGRGPHRLHISAADFEDELMRQNYLVLDRWMVLRFPFLMLRDKPRQCQQLLLQMLGSAGSEHAAAFNALGTQEKRILSQFCRSVRPLRPAQIAVSLDLHRNTVLKYLAGLKEAGFIAAVDPAHKVIRKYQVVREKIPYPFL